MKLKKVNKSVFSKNLVKYREKKNYKNAKQFYQYLEEVYKNQGKKIPFTYMTYSAYENGSRTPKLETVIQLAQILDTSLDLLLGFYDSTDYIEILVNYKYKIQHLNNDMLIITNKSGEQASISINSLMNCFHNFYKEIPNRVTQFLDKKIQEASIIDRQKKIERLATLAVHSIATVLGIDYKRFIDQLNQVSTFTLFKNEPIQALFFYYFTHCRPDLQVTETKQIIKHFTNCIFNSNKGINQSQYEENIKEFITYEPEIRNTEVENCFLSYTISDEKKVTEYQKKDFKELKFGFFLILLRKSVK